MARRKKQSDADVYLLAFAGQAAGAMPHGTRVKKVWGEPGDTHALGAKATVTGSIHDRRLGYGYFVEWDDMPGVPVFVMGKKIEKDEDGGT